MVNPISNTRKDDEFVHGTGPNGEWRGDDIYNLGYFSREFAEETAKRWNGRGEQPWEEVEKGLRWERENRLK